MLELSTIVDISVSTPPVGQGPYSINNIGLFTTDTPLASWTTVSRAYVSLAQVGVDFGTGTETYQQAEAIFSQSPNLLSASGQLIIIPLLTLAAGAVNTYSINTVGSGYHLNDIITIVQSANTTASVKVTSIDTNGEVLAVALNVVGSGYTAANGLSTTV